jgi:flagellin
MSMSTVINTNLASLNAQRQLHSTSGQLSSALQRLSSGLRINSAKDDAAGLSIAERMSTQVRGLNQGIRNIADGVSLAQTAEGGLDSIANNLQRIRELAVQSANFTNTSSDRAAIQMEVTQLQEEITRVANQTAFNGVKLLNGSFNTATFQAGANVGETIDITGIADARATALGQYQGVNQTGIVVNNVNSAKSIQVGATTFNFTATNDTASVVSAINNLGISGLAASVGTTGNLEISYAAPSGVTGNVVLNNVAATTQTFAIGTTGALMSAVDLTTVAGANQAIRSTDAALTSVNSSRARLGAAMNRFEAAISAQRITAEAQTASRSRIQDADFALETAALTRAQILQQSGMAILSQANALPQNVLSLLR